MADLRIDVPPPEETIDNGFRSRFPAAVNRLVGYVRRRLARNSKRGTLSEEIVVTPGSHSATPMAERNRGTNNQSFSINNNSPSPVNRGTSGRVTSSGTVFTNPLDPLGIAVVQHAHTNDITEKRIPLEPSAVTNNQTSSGQPAETDNQTSSVTKVYRVLRPLMKPGPAENVGVMFFLTWVAIKSQGEARFPFQTHPKTTWVVITTLVFYGVFSAADWVISALSTDSVWAFVVWLGMRLCLCILV